MGSAGFSGIRVVTDERHGFVLGGGKKDVLLRAEARGAVASSKDAKAVWEVTRKDLGTWETGHALIRAGDRLYVGGSSHDGAKGGIAVVNAADGKVLQVIEMPFGVTASGIAAADGQLLVSLINGQLICLGGDGVPPVTK